MKAVFALSLCLNLALVCCLALILVARRPAQQNGICSGIPADASVPGAAESESSPARLSPEAPFRWDRIESADYRTYIANLRGIGCPEQTVRDIVSADLHAAYAPLCQKLEHELGKTSSASRPFVQQQLQALHAEEISFLSALLGDRSPEVDTAGLRLAEKASQESFSLPQRSRIGASLPLVFQPIETNSLRLGAGQMEAIENLKQRFLLEIGTQDPNDPAYRERWLRSQPAIDDDLRGMIGATAYQNHQITARGFAPGEWESGAQP